RALHVTGVQTCALPIFGDLAQVNGLLDGAGTGRRGHGVSLPTGMSQERPSSNPTLRKSPGPKVSWACGSATDTTRLPASVSMSRSEERRGREEGRRGGA